MLIVNLELKVTLQETNSKSPWKSMLLRDNPAVSFSEGIRISATVGFITRWEFIWPEWRHSPAISGFV